MQMAQVPAVAAHVAAAVGNSRIAALVVAAAAAAVEPVAHLLASEEPLRTADTDTQETAVPQMAAVPVR
jgi:hypothetical protein